MRHVLLQLYCSRELVGIPTKREIHLINPSIVAIYYEIEIPHDGDLPALTCEDFANLTEKVNPVANIKEFEFSPSCGTAQSQETVTLEVIMLFKIYCSCLAFKFF